MFCRYCGRETLPGKWCAYCGKKLIDDEAEQKPEEQAVSEPYINIAVAPPECDTPEQTEALEKAKKSGGLMLAFGIVAIVTGFIPYVGVIGLVLGIIALGSSVRCRNRLVDLKKARPGITTAAVIVSACGCVCAVMGVCTITLGLMMTRLFPNEVAALLEAMLGW